MSSKYRFKCGYYFENALQPPAAWDIRNLKDQEFALSDLWDRECISVCCMQS